MGSARRRLFGFAYIVVVFFQTETSASDWPGFRGADRDGISQETGFIKEFSKEGPRVLWKKDIGVGYSGPAVARDRVILFHRLGDKETVEALKAAGGESLWTYSYDASYIDDFGKGDGPRSTPLIKEGRVYALGAAGRLHCLDLETGKIIWARDLAADYPFRKGFFGVATTPWIEGDHLIVNVGAPQAGIVAFDRATGKEQWKATSDHASYSSPLGAAIDGCRHILVFTREGLVSLNPADGVVRFSKPWRSRLNASVNAATPIVVGDKVFISACYGTGAGLFKISKDKAQEVWKGDDILSNHYDTSIYYDGYLYGVDGRQEEGANLRCVALETGKVQWTEKGFGCATLLLAEGRLWALTESGDLVLMEASPKGYRELARGQVLAAPARSPLALAEGRLFGRDNKKLICWDVKKK